MIAIRSFSIIVFVSSIVTLSNAFKAKPVSSEYLPPMKYERASSTEFLNIVYLGFVDYKYKQTDEKKYYERIKL